MADQELPKDYDAIVLGTGMPECILAASLSRIGWKVLHMDRNDYYSGDWATLHFGALLKWIEKRTGPDNNDDLEVKKPGDDELSESECLLPLQVNASNLRNIQSKQHIWDDLPESKEEVDDSDCHLVDKDCNSSLEVQQAGVAGEPVIGSNKDQNVSDEENISHTGEAGTQDADDTNKCHTSSQEVLQPTVATSDSEISNKAKPKAEDKRWSFSKIKAAWRKFNIDLAPKILYCRGPMVELLISSDVAKYCEFRTLTRVLTQLGGKLQKVPCSRSDVFSTKQVSMIEKRMLMKFLNFCLEFEKHPNEFEGSEEITFYEFMKQKKLTDNVIHFIFHSIAMGTKSTTVMEGLVSTQKFLSSLGRYGNTAFLWPLYGSGELPQAFCRLCAVFGGVYCLRRTAASLVIDENKQCTGIIDTEGQRLNAKHVVMEASYASQDILPKHSKQSFISRGILITDRSIMPDSDEHISLLRLPPNEKQTSQTTLLELSCISISCPKDIYLVYLSCKGVNGAQEDLSSTVDSFFKPWTEDSTQTEKPAILWSVFYDQIDSSNLDLTVPDLQGVHVLSGPDLHLDFDHSIQQAKDLFEKLCPGEEFLPKAPNPEDIIFDDGAQAKDGASGFESGEPNDESDKSGDVENTTMNQVEKSADVKDGTIEKPVDTENKTIVQEEKSANAENKTIVQEEMSANTESKTIVQEEKSANAENKTIVQEEMSANTGNKSNE